MTGVESRENVRDGLSPCSRGFTLLEMVVMVLLLAVFMTIITALFKAAYLGHRDSSRRDALDLRVDAAVGALRRDVWASREMTASRGELLLVTGDHSTVRWQFGSEWTRTETAERSSILHWKEMPGQGVDAAVDGPLVTVHVDVSPEPHARVETLTLVSQVMRGAVR